jgi:hypothetical protein
MTKRTKTVLGVAFGLAVAIQLVPVDRTNPPVEATVDAPEQILPILKRSCFDCHSHETKWPGYSYVAPISWLVRHDVTEAREHMNFSTWQKYDTEKRKKLLGEAWEEVSEGAMPMPMYTWMHPGAKLSDDDKKLLYTWVKSVNPQLEESGDGDEHEHP